MGKNTLSAGSLGNILEWLDFGLFIYLAPLLGQLFFSPQNPATATLETLAIFAAGFICRPLGSILFGFLGDRYGRVITLRISILLITLSIVLLGLLPTYNHWGLAASIIFVLLRLLQGLSVGGEYSTAMIYLAESAPQQRRGFFTSFAAVGANVGFLLASLLAFLLHTCFTSEAIQAGAWRLPFLLVGIIGIVIFIFRLRLLETPVYKDLVKKQELVAWPLFTALTRSPKQLLQILALSCMGGVFYYAFFGYMPTYLEKTAGFSLSIGFIVQMVFLMAMLVLVPIAGLLGDRFGRKVMLGGTASGIILFAYLCFHLMQLHSLFWLFAAFSLVTLLSSCEQGNSLITVVEVCPADVRVSGVSFAYNVGMAIFGGTSPLIISLLSLKVNDMAPALYVMLAAAVTLIAVLTIPETYQRSLTRVTSST